MSDEMIKDDSREDREAMEALDMAIDINKKNDVYVCSVCGYEYDPELGDPDHGIPAGTLFEDLPDDWTCPLCGVGKDMFEMKMEVNTPDGSVTNA